MLKVLAEYRLHIDWSSFVIWVLASMRIKDYFQLGRQSWMASLCFISKFLNIATVMLAGSKNLMTQKNTKPPILLALISTEHTTHSCMYINAFNVFSQCAVLDTILKSANPEYSHHSHGGRTDREPDKCG